MRCHRSRGESGQGEGDRTNSLISDALVDGTTLEREKYRRFEDLSLQSYEAYEKKRTEKNAWYVCIQVERESDNDFVFADLDEQSSSSTTIQFISDEQITAVVVQGP